MKLYNICYFIKENKKKFSEIMGYREKSKGMSRLIGSQD